MALKNPYEDEKDNVEIRISNGVAWVFVFLFLLLITLPPLYRQLFEIAKPKGTDRWIPAIEFFKPQSDEGLLAHLKKFDNKLEDADFTEPPRRVIQTVLTRGPLHEGNRKTRIGKDGWLYLQTALDSLTGYGPLTPEPDSVAKDPRRKPWRSPLGAIKNYAEQLEEFGVELILVPIPVKPMIYPEHLGGATDAPVTHPDAAAFYAQLGELPNVDIVDMSGAFWELKESTQVFLKQDTHWTPAGMEFAAGQLAAHLMAKPWFESPGDAEIKAEPREERASLGDLVEKIDIGDAGFAEETVRVEPVAGKTRAESSPIVLLGDSFTNIYSDDAELDWGLDAGFAEHLSLKLGMQLDVIAINGKAATGVRQSLAERKGSATLMRKKKAVVWAIAARDLFLSETAARKDKVVWTDVAFDTREPDPLPPSADTSGAAEPMAVVKAKLVLKSEIPDPQSTTYKSLLYGVDYEVTEIVSGNIELEDGKIGVLHWGFKLRERLPSSKFEVGDERTLRLVPFNTQKHLKSIQTRYDGDLFDLYWDLAAPQGAGGERNSEDSDPASKPDRKPSMATPHLVASLGCAGFALLLGLGIRRTSRK